MIRGGDECRERNATVKGRLRWMCLADYFKKEIYGYELVQELRGYGFETIVGGTIYPLLQKLEKQRLIKAELKKSPDGPDRKYFSLTEAGEEYLNSFKQQWENLVSKK